MVNFCIERCGEPSVLTKLKANQNQKAGQGEVISSWRTQEELHVIRSWTRSKQLKLTLIGLALTQTPYPIDHNTTTTITTTTTNNNKGLKTRILYPLWSTKPMKTSASKPKSNNLSPHPLQSPEIFITWPPAHVASMLLVVEYKRGITTKRRRITTWLRQHRPRPV